MGNKKNRQYISKSMKGRILRCKKTKNQNSVLLNTNNDLKHLKESTAGYKFPLEPEYSNNNAEFQLGIPNIFSIQSELETYIKQEQEDTLTNFNENHIANNTCCILCFHNDEQCELIDLSDDYSYFPTLIKELTSVEITLDKNYPTKICDKCSMDLEYLSQFKIKCIRNVMILQKKMAVLNKAREISEIVPLSNSIEEQVLIFKNETTETVNEIILPNSEILENSNKHNLSINREMNKSISLKCENKKNYSFLRANKRKKIFKRKKSNKEKLPCHICGQIYNSSYMKDHLNIHNNIRPYKCEYEDCKKQFASPSGLAKHKRFHSPIKRYKCNECDKAFHTNSGLKTHVSYHGDPKLPCKICGKMLRNTKAIKQHMMTHTNERNYPCEECEKSFMNMYTLRVHRRVHTKEKPFLCSKCGESFAYKCLLKAHTERYHPANLE